MVARLDSGEVHCKMTTLGIVSTTFTDLLLSFSVEKNKSTSFWKFLKATQKLSGPKFFHDAGSL